MKGSDIVREEMYDVLLDSSRMDLKNGEIMMQSEMYYYAVAFFVQGIKKMLNSAYLHIKNKKLDYECENDLLLDEMDFLPEEVKEGIKLIFDSFKKIDSNSDIEILKSLSIDINRRTKSICVIIEDIIMGRKV